MEKLAHILPPRKDKGDKKERVTRKVKLSRPTGPFSDLLEYFQLMEERENQAHCRDTQ